MDQNKKFLRFASVENTVGREDTACLVMIDSWKPR